MVTMKDVHKQEAIDRLRKILKPGDTVWTTVKHVSRSGMMRAINAQIIEDNQPRSIAYNVALAIGNPFLDSYGAVRMDGCGMDMGFSLVESLGYNLYPEGFECTGDKCPSNDHSNGDRDYTPHHHKSGGYALRQRWM